MENRYITLLVTLGLLLVILPVATAQPIYEQGENITISIPCTIDGEYCQTGTWCNTTIINPDQQVLLNNEGMTHNGAVFEINLTTDQTQETGDYEFNVACCDGNDCFSKSLTFSITTNGNPPPESGVIVFFTLIFIIIAGGLLFLLIYNIYHFAGMDFDIKDLLINLGAYFGLIIAYALGREYLGNPFFNSFLLWTIGVTAFSNVILPITAFIVSYLKGEMNI